MISSLQRKVQGSGQVMKRTSGQLPKREGVNSCRTVTSPWTELQRLSQRWRGELPFSVTTTSAAEPSPKKVVAEVGYSYIVPLYLSKVFPYIKSSKPALYPRQHVETPDKRGCEHSVTTSCHQHKSIPNSFNHNKCGYHIQQSK